MKRDYLYCFVASLTLGGVAYFVSGSLYFLIGVFLVYFMATAFLLVPILRSYASKIRRRRECYRFINAYLIALSVSQSLEKSYGAGSESAIGEEMEVMHSIASEDPESRTRYLASYYQEGVYSMFLSVLTLYLEQGGDILYLSRDLMAELTRVEESGQEKEKRGVRALFQFMLLWVMSLAMLGFMRFALKDFFASISTSPTFLSCVAVYFLFLLISIIAFFLFLTEERLKLPQLPFMRKKGGKHERVEGAD